MKKLKFKMMANLIDGTPVIFDGEFTKDTPVYVIDAEGKEVPALDGEHQLEDGTKFVTVEGKISEIFPAEELSIETEVEVETPESTDKPEYDIESIVNQLAALESALSAAMIKIAELEKKSVEQTLEVEQKLSEIKLSEKKESTVEINKYEEYYTKIQMLK